MSSVQFKGVDSVIQAFQNRQVPSWSLWQGKQFMFKCESQDISESSIQLETILETLSQSSNAIYTLKVYEDLPKEGKIKNNTPDDGSFNFKLNIETQEINSNQYSTLRNQGKIEERLIAIEKKLDEPFEDEEEKPRSKLGMIGDILNDPGVSAILIPLLTKVLGIGNINQNTERMMPVTISGINADDEDDKLKQAISILKTADSNLSYHLMKLAELSQNDAGSFQFLLQTLDRM